MSTSVCVFWEVIFFLDVFHFEEHSMPQTRQEKKCPVKILETLLLPLTSIQKA